MRDSCKPHKLFILSMALILLTTKSFAIQCRAELGEHCTNYGDEYCKACPTCPLGSGWDTTFKPRKVNICGDIECYPCVNCPFGKYKLNSRTGSDYDRRQTQKCIPSQDKVESMDVERPALPSPFNDELNRKRFQCVMLTGAVFISIGFIGVFCHFKKRKPGTDEVSFNLLGVELNSSDGNDDRNVEHGLFNPNRGLNQDYDLALTNAGHTHETEFPPAPDVHATNSSDDIDYVDFEIDAGIGHTLPETIQDAQLSGAMTRNFYRGNICK